MVATDTILRIAIAQRLSPSAPATTPTSNPSAREPTPTTTRSSRKCTKIPSTEYPNAASRFVAVLDENSIDSAHTSTAYTEAARSVADESHSFRRSILTRSRKLPSSPGSIANAVSARPPTSSARATVNPIRIGRPTGSQKAVRSFGVSKCSFMRSLPSLSPQYPSRSRAGGRRWRGPGRHPLLAFAQAFLQFDHTVGCDDRATRNGRDRVDVLPDPRFFGSANQSQVVDRTPEPTP